MEQNETQLPQENLNTEQTAENTSAVSLENGFKKAEGDEENVEEGSLKEFDGVPHFAHYTTAADLEANPDGELVEGELIYIPCASEEAPAENGGDAE